MPTPHFSEIISLYPEDEPFCAGYAPSQGRRCRMRTNALGRTCAMTILNEATKILHRGHMPTRDLLIDLAHYTLCTRFHQGQAEGLAEKWRREIERFLDEQARFKYREPARRRSRAEKVSADIELGVGQGQERRVPARRSISAAPTTPAQAPPRTRFVPESGRLGTVPSTVSAANSLTVGGSPSRSVARPPSPITASPASPALRDTAQIRVETRSRISATEPNARRVDSRISHSVPGGEETTNRQSPSPRRTFRGSDNTGIEEAVRTTRTTTQPTSRTTAASTDSTGVAENSPGRARNESMAPAALSRPRPSLPTSPSRATTTTPTRTPTRRSIEGDCSICFEPLQKAQCGLSSPHCSDGERNEYGASPATADRAALGRLNRRTENDGESGVVAGAEYAGLSWCKAHCGVNYHTKCIRSWLAAATRPTCPTCRGIWRD
ncbi:hypothetical protein BDW71DRAFT_170784 [Aspergillus fruticulosus]